MKPQSQNAHRDETIRLLAHRLLIEQGWPDSGNFDDYYVKAREIYDAGLMGMAFGGPIPESLLTERDAKRGRA